MHCQFYFHYARENRQEATGAEALLWKFLRNRKLRGYKFRRQHPLYDFIADFYCAESRLAIELDGEYHRDKEQTAADTGRTYILKELQITVIRFTNREVLTNTRLVLDATIRELKKVPFSTPPSPLEKGRDEVNAG
jgi:very-short-patch-repair endonuclease